jgi:hypothetical protein
MLTRSCIVLVLLIPTSSVAFSRTHQLERRFLDNKRDQVMVGYTPEALTRAISRYAEISLQEAQDVVSSAGLFFAGKLSPEYPQELLASLSGSRRDIAL